jgi:hypothetical protein
LKPSTNVGGHGHERSWSFDSFYFY